MSTLKVIYMDDREETFTHVDVTYLDHCVKLTRYGGISGVFLGEQVIPFVNVRKLERDE